MFKFTYKCATTALKLVKAAIMCIKYGLLNKREVKMVGYWPSSTCHPKHAKKERGQYPAILAEQAWSIKDLLYGIKHHNMKMFLAGHNPYPERAR